MERQPDGDRGVHEGRVRHTLEEGVPTTGVCFCGQCKRGKSQQLVRDAPGADVCVKMARSLSNHGAKNQHERKATERGPLRSEGRLH